MSVTENNAPTIYKGTSWVNAAGGGPMTLYDLPTSSSGNFSQPFGTLSGTPAVPLVKVFEFGGNAGSVFATGPTAFDAPLDFDFDFELKFTPTSYADTNGDGINDNFGPAFAVPEPSSFLLLSLLGPVSYTHLTLPTKA